MPPPSPVPLLALAARVASSSSSTAAAAAVRAVPPAAASSLPTSVGGVRSFFSSYAKPWEAEGAPAAGNGEGEEEVLNRAALVAHLAETHDLTKAEGGRILDTVLDSITESVSQGKKVRISQFGMFWTRRSEARTMKSPQGTLVDVPAKNHVKFRASVAFKELINK